MAHENPQQFFDAIHEKFTDKIKEGRSAQPWDDYRLGELGTRFEEEYAEYEKARKGFSVAAIQDELVDIASLAMFIWIKYESVKDWDNTKQR